MDKNWDFNVQLHRTSKDAPDLFWNSKTKITTIDISMKRNDKTFLEDVRQLLVREFEGYGLSRNNYNIFCQDVDGEWIRVRNNDEFIIAMDMLEGPDYKLITQVKFGMYVVYVIDLKLLFKLNTIFIL